MNWIFISFLFLFSQSSYFPLRTELRLRISENNVKKNCLCYSMITLNEIIASIYLLCVHVYKKLITYIKGKDLNQADFSATFL